MSAIAHTFNDTVINQRPTDGYVDATAMCQANGKQFNDYFRLETTQRFLEALATETGIPASELVQIRKGGDVRLQGTWVHPYVAINLGQWCSPEFAVFVSKLVFAWMTGSQPPIPQPQDPFADPEVQELLETLMHTDLTRAEMRVLCLIRGAEADGTIDELDYRAIAARLGVAKSTVFRAIASLEQAGLMQVQRRRAFRINPFGMLAVAGAEE